MNWLEIIAQSDGFDWNKGNVGKNAVAHQVSCEEAEQVFINRPLFFAADPTHSATELRIKAFGKTDEDRLLTISFTMRGSKIRVISARDMNHKERKIHETRHP
ncbi:MAG: BrnT family toxin [Verrucomicrobiae bacterium]|nr:BrnT family toxin [Verrucomicrobiae bacterium]